MLSGSKYGSKGRLYKVNRKGVIRYIISQNQSGNLLQSPFISGKKKITGEKQNSGEKMPIFAA
jgi:hypothetical protein